MPDTEVLNISLSPQEPGRLDLLLLEELKKAEAFSALSRGLLKKLFLERKISIDGRVSAPSDVIARAVSVRVEGLVTLLNSISSLKASETCFVPIVYEDEDLLVLHKPSGLPSVSLSGEETRSASSSALARWPALADIPGIKPLEPGLLHRLDTATSGLLAFAKTASEFERLKAEWKNRGVGKTYRTVVENQANEPPSSPRTLSLPIGHPSDSSKRMLVLDPKHTKHSIRGRPMPAITRIRSVKSLPENRFDLEITIETGVMHQIRAHLAHEGFPILGDPLYGKGSRSQISRLMLHAWRLELPLKNGARLSLEALLPW
jgi:23S rRNA pseudouridine1911/1915/1917 synthase